MVKFTGKGVVNLLITSVILITGALFVFNKPANAAPVTYLKASAMTPEQLVVSYAYFYALNNICTATDTLTNSDSLLSVISNNTKPAFVGHIAENYAGNMLNVAVSLDDGKMKCGGIFQAAIRLWTGKSIESLDQATKDDILTKLGYKNEVANKYYCYAKFSGAPNENYPPLYKYDSSVTTQSVHPFLSLSANGISSGNVYEDVLGYDGFTVQGMSPIDSVLNAFTVLGETIGTDKYNDFCSKVASQFEGIVSDTAYAEKSTTSTSTWKLNGKYLIYDFAYGSIYENKNIVLNEIGKYYVYNYYYMSASDSYGCGGTNLGEKDAFIKSIEGSTSTTLSTADKLLWLDNQKYPYDEIVKITGLNGALTTYSYYQKNKYLTELNSTIKLMELQGVDKTCHEIANLMSIESQNIADAIKRNRDNPYGDVLSLLIADNNKAPSVTNDGITNADDSETKTTCAVDGIGWLLCPITKAMSRLVDAAYEQISQMLTTPALNTDTSGNKTKGVVENSMYAMWKIMRTFANIAFVIAFIMITFSQMTSFGVSNYGIKKMLPKLIIAAILVNISYFICAIAIDISNITGTSIKSLLEGFNNAAVATTEQPTLDILAGAAKFTIIGTVAGVAATTAVVSTGGYLAALTLLLPGLIAAIVAIMTVFLVLTLRQALIILLVVVSPLALVAYILPNTESWFKKWKDLFITMLMMFPIISAVFGISKLASSIVISGANGHGMVALMGMFIQFIPLAITPLVLKSAGGVLNKFAGMVNNPNRGPLDAMKRGAVGYRKRVGNRADNEAMNMEEKPGFKKMVRYGARRAFLRHKSREEIIDENQKREFSRAKDNYIEDAAIQNKMSFTEKVKNMTPGFEGKGKGLMDQMVAGGASDAKTRLESILGEQQLKSALQSLSRELAVLKGSGRGNETDTYLKNRVISTTHSSAEKRAAMNSLAAMGRDGVIRELINNTSVDQTSLQEAISSNISSLSSKAPDIVKGRGPSFNNLTGEQFVKFSFNTVESNIKYIEDLHTKSRNGTASATEIADLNNASQSLNSTILDIANDSTLRASFSGDAGNQILKTISTSSPEFQAYVTGALSNVSRIQADGKIR